MKSSEHLSPNASPSRAKRIGRGRSTTSIRAHKLPAGTPKYLRTRPKDINNVALIESSISSYTMPFRPNRFFFSCINHT
ncbi:hypothetical protein YC2023_008882 [Brassica napus]